MNPKKLLALAVLSLFPATLLNAGVFEYDWSGTKPGFSGKIYLDAPSSSLAPYGGTVQDLLPGSYVQTPGGTFSVLDLGLIATFSTPTIAWDAAQISFMGLIFDPSTPLTDYYGPEAGAANAGNSSDSLSLSEVHNGSLMALNSNTDYTGHWLAVPEPAATSLLALGLGFLALARPGRSAKP